MFRFAKKKLFIIFGSVVLAGGVAAGAVVIVNKLVKKHVDLGMSKVEVLNKLGDPDHTSESGDTWYYFGSGIGKKYRQKDGLEHSWNEANQIKAEAIGLEIETQHFESRTIQFNSDKKVISYLYDTDTKYTYEHEKFSSWNEKVVDKISTTIPDNLQCYKIGQIKDSTDYKYAFVDSLSFDYETSFSDKSLLKVADEKSYLLRGQNSDIALSWNYRSDMKFTMKINATAYDAKVKVFCENAYVSIEGEGLYNIGDEAMLRAILTPGYAIEGWYERSDFNREYKLSSSTDFPFLIKEIGGWEFNVFCNVANYQITYQLNGGTNDSQNPHTFTIEDEIIFSNPSKENKEFLGWYNQDGKQVIEIKKGTHEDIILNAYFYESIAYVLDGGFNNPNNPSCYSPLEETLLYNPSKEGYQFVGWFDINGKKVTSISVGTTGTITLTAHWTANLNNLSVISEDTSKGTVAITCGSGYSDESITVVATPFYDCVFKGWYHESTKVSNDVTYTFTMPTSDYSLVAHFLTEIEEEEHAQKYATRPLVSNDGKTITYGLYPQRNVSNSATVDALNALTTPESNGWYLYEGDYYVKVSAKPYDTNFKFDNGTTIKKGTTYWFKCEPIIWNVLSNNSGEYYIVSSVLLDAHCYYNSTSFRTIDGQTVYSNNYKYSDIRIWLNADFYNSAFDLGNEHIQTTTVNNSALTTYSSSNSYACDNTEDKVFLPSYQDYINSSYGFSPYDDEARYCRTTDWARARGACGFYWTRSPDCYNHFFVCSVGGNGYPDYHEYVNDSSIGVRPGISILIA